MTYHTSPAASAALWREAMQYGATLLVVRHLGHWWLSVNGCKVAWIGADKEDGDDE